MPRSRMASCWYAVLCRRLRSRISSASDPDLCRSTISARSSIAEDIVREVWVASGGGVERIASLNFEERRRIERFKRGEDSPGGEV